MIFLARRSRLRSVFIGFIALLFISPALASNTSAEPVASAIALYEQGDLDSAEAAFKALQQSQPDAQWHYYLGRIHEQRGDLETAASYIEEAAAMDDTQSLYFQKLGEYYGTMAGQASFLKQMRLAKKSKSSFERAVELDGSNLDARSGLLTYYLQAPGIAGGSVEKAEAQAIEIGNQDSARGHFAMARVLAHRGDHDGAEREYRKALEEAPANSDTGIAFGVYLTSEERYADALSLYRQRLEAESDDIGVTYQFGRTASISGLELEEGRRAFIRYTTEFQPGPENPGLDWAHYRLGLIYAQLDDPQAAAREYRQALAINPDHPEAKKALKKVE